MTTTTGPRTILVDEKTGAPIAVGASVVDFRGDPETVRGWVDPTHAGSTGRVIVGGEDWRDQRQYFPGVIGATLVERED